MLISIIILTYNQRNELALILDGLLHQTDQSFEVIITDDGSQQELKDLIMHYQKKSSCRIAYVRQPDKGFRAAKARNLGVKQAQGDYFIFLDGDCVPASDFVAQHRCLAESGWFVRGTRLKLTNAFSQIVCAQHTPIFNYGIFKWIWLRLTGKAKRMSPLLRLPDGFFRKFKRDKWRGATGFNLAFYRDDFYAVGGFDERFEGQGYQDSDLVVRMLNYGVQRKDGFYAIMVIHLGDAKEKLLQKNYLLLEQTIREHRVYAECGISQS